MSQFKDLQPLVAPAQFVTVPLAARITGLSEKAIRRKIEDGKWIEGREIARSPDGGVFVNLKGYQQWVERGQGSRFGTQASAFVSSSTEKRTKSV